MIVSLWLTTATVTTERKYIDPDLDDEDEEKDENAPNFPYYKPIIVDIVPNINEFSMQLLYKLISDPERLIDKNDFKHLQKQAQSKPSNPFGD